MAPHPDSTRCIGRASTLVLAVTAMTAASPAPAVGRLTLPPGNRIMVVAPHPDDEVLACAGLVRQALSLGDSVVVVYVTAGDGSWTSTVANKGSPLVGPNDYLTLGRTRIDEARRGAATLGLDGSRLVFLGFPDACLAELVHRRWDSAFESPTTDVSAAPYLNVSSRYAGRELLERLFAAIKQYRPTLLFVPHALDAHADHWAVAQLVAVAAETWRLVDTLPFPATYQYLVHHPGYPRPDDPLDLLPPADLAGKPHRWLALPLSEQDLDVKEAAVECHLSQTSVPGNRLFDYCGYNELFDSLPEPAVELVEDAPALSLPGTARFDTLAVAIRDSSIDVTVCLKDRPTSFLDYRLFFHAVCPSAAGISHHLLAIDLVGTDGKEQQPAPSVERLPDGWRVSLPRGWLPDSAALFCTAEVRRGSLLLNHTGLGRLAPALPEQSE